MSFWRAYYHLVWATHNREPYISAELETRLYGYLIRKASELDCVVYAINGVADHVHLLVAIPPKHAVSDVVKSLKGASSHDISAQGFALQWQRGYGVLTCGEKQLSIAQTYIEAQKQHHKEANVIKMLEYCTDVDEGPTMAGKHVGNGAAIVRDDAAFYDHVGPSPF